MVICKSLIHIDLEIHNMLLTRSERAAVQEGRLTAEAARGLMRRRVWTLLGGVALGYGTLWAVSRLF